MALVFKEQLIQFTCQLSLYYLLTKDSYINIPFDELEVIIVGCIIYGIYE